MSMKAKGIWERFGGWLLLGLPLAVLVIGLAVGQPQKDHVTPERTEAVPPAESEVTFDMEVNRAYTAKDGTVVIPATEQPGKSQSKPVKYLPDPDQVWEDYASLSTQGYTLPEDAALPDGSMGILTIPKLELSAPVYETEEGGEMESMTKGVAHFASTSAWKGTVGLCSHNVAPAGAVAYFRDIHKLAKGDIIRYKTALGEREYRVTEVKEISEDDWTALSRSEENRLTLITCVTGKPNMRLMVQAVEE